MKADVREARVLCEEAPVAGGGEQGDQAHGDNLDTREEPCLRDRIARAADRIEARVGRPSEEEDCLLAA